MGDLVFGLSVCGKGFRVSGIGYGVEGLGYGFSGMGLWGFEYGVSVWCLVFSV